MAQTIWASFYKKKRLQCLYSLPASVILFLEELCFENITKREVPNSPFLFFYEYHFINESAYHTLSKLPIYMPYYTGSHLPIQSRWLIDGTPLSAFELHGVSLCTFFKLNESESIFLDTLFDEFDTLVSKP